MGIEARDATLPDRRCESQRPRAGNRIGESLAEGLRVRGSRS
jgi:hypothetical protein